MKFMMFEKAVMKLSRWMIARFKKLTAVVTVSCFIVTGVCGQAISALSQENRDTSSYKQAAENLFIPASIGRVTSAGYHGSDTVVITISNLHCHAEVQKNINSILVSLDEKYPLSRVYLEGAAGKIDAAWLKTIEPKMRAKLLESLIGNGQLTGAEYFAVNTNKDTEFLGLENDKIYRENSLRLGKITADQDEVNAIVEQMGEKLESVKNAYYNPSQKNLEKLVKKHRDGKLNSVKYYHALKKYAEGLGIDINGYRNLARFEKLLGGEKDLNYRRISGQMSALLGVLKNRLPYAAYQSVIEQATKDPQHLEGLYRTLARLVRTYNIDISGEFPELNRFFVYIRDNQEINPVSLIRDENRLLQEINLGMASNESERNVAFLLDFYRHFSDYFNNKITADDYDYFSKNLKEFKVQYECYTDDRSLAKLDPYFDTLDVYYQTNLERNQWFIRNMFGETAKSNGSAVKPLALFDNIDSAINDLPKAKEIIVTVTGGFHTPGLEKLLDEKGITYLSLTPNVTQEARYADAVYWEKINEQNVIFSQAFADYPVTGEATPLHARVSILVTGVLLDSSMKSHPEAAMSELLTQAKEYVGDRQMSVSFSKKDSKGNIPYTVTIDGKEYKYEFTKEGISRIEGAEKNPAIVKIEKRIDTDEGVRTIVVEFFNTVVAAVESLILEKHETVKSQADDKEVKKEATLDDMLAVLGQIKKTFAGGIAVPVWATYAINTAINNDDNNRAAALNFVPMNGGIGIEVPQGQKKDQPALEYGYAIYPVSIPADRIPAALMEKISEKAAAAEKKGKKLDGKTVSAIVQEYLANEFEGTIEVVSDELKSNDLTTNKHERVVLDKPSVVAVVSARDGSLQVQVPFWVRNMQPATISDLNGQIKKAMPSNPVKTDKDWYKKVDTGMDPVRLLGENTARFYEDLANGEAGSRTLLKDTLRRINEDSITNLINPDKYDIRYNEKLGTYISLKDKDAETKYFGKNLNAFIAELHRAGLISQMLNVLVTPDQKDGILTLVKDEELQNQIIRFQYRLAQRLDTLATQNGLFMDPRIFGPLTLRRMGQDLESLNHAIHSDNAFDLSKANLTYKEFEEKLESFEITLNAGEKEKAQKLFDHYNAKGEKWFFNVLQLQEFLNEEHFVKVFRHVKVSDPVRAHASEMGNPAYDGSGRIGSLAVMFRFVDNVNDNYNGKLVIRTRQIKGNNEDAKFKRVLKDTEDMFKDAEVQRANFRINIGKETIALNDIVKDGKKLTFERGKVLEAQQDYLVTQRIKSVYPVIIKIDGREVGTIYYIDVAEFNEGLASSLNNAALHLARQPNTPRPMIVVDGKNIHLVNKIFDATPGGVHIHHGSKIENKKVKQPSVWSTLALRKLSQGIAEEMAAAEAAAKGETFKPTLTAADEINNLLELETQMGERFKDSNESNDSNDVKVAFDYTKTQIHKVMVDYGMAFNDIAALMYREPMKKTRRLKYNTTTSCSTNGATHFVDIIQAFTGFGDGNMSLTAFTFHSYTNSDIKGAVYAMLGPAETGAGTGIEALVPNIDTALRAVRTPTALKDGTIDIVGGSVYNFMLKLPYGVSKDALVKYLKRVGAERPEILGIVTKEDMVDGKYLSKDWTTKKTGSVVFVDELQEIEPGLIAIPIGYNNETDYVARLYAYDVESAELFKAQEAKLERYDLLKGIDRDTKALQQEPSHKAVDALLTASMALTLDNAEETKTVASVNWAGIKISKGKDAVNFLNSYGQRLMEEFSDKNIDTKQQKELLASSIKKLSPANIIGGMLEGKKDRKENDGTITKGENLEIVVGKSGIFESKKDAKAQVPGHGENLKAFIDGLNKIEQMNGDLDKLVILANDEKLQNALIEYFSRSYLYFDSVAAETFKNINVFEPARMWLVYRAESLHEALVKDDAINVNTATAEEIIAHLKAKGIDLTANEKNSLSKLVEYYTEQGVVKPWVFDILQLSEIFSTKHFSAAFRHLTVGDVGTWAPPFEAPTEAFSTLPRQEEKPVRYSLLRNVESEFARGYFPGQRTTMRKLLRLVKEGKAVIGGAGATGFTTLRDADSWTAGMISRLKEEFDVLVAGSRKADSVASRKFVANVGSGAAFLDAENVDAMLKSHIIVPGVPVMGFPTLLMNIRREVVNRKITGKVLMINAIPMDNSRLDEFGMAIKEKKVVINRYIEPGEFFEKYLKGKDGYTDELDKMEKAGTLSHEAVVAEKEFVDDIVKFAKTANSMGEVLDFIFKGTGIIVVEGMGNIPGFRIQNVQNRLTADKVRIFTPDEWAGKAVAALIKKIDSNLEPEITIGFDGARIMEHRTVYLAQYYDLTALTNDEYEAALPEIEKIHNRRLSKIAELDAKNIITPEEKKKLAELRKKTEKKEVLSFTEKRMLVALGRKNTQYIEEGKPIFQEAMDAMKELANSIKNSRPVSKDIRDIKAKEPMINVAAVEAILTAADQAKAISPAPATASDLASPVTKGAAEAVRQMVTVIAQWFSEKVGAFTGMINLDHLLEIGIISSLIGHSETRKRIIIEYDKEGKPTGKKRMQQGDIDSVINKKIKLANSKGVTTMLAVGEPRYVRDANTEIEPNKHIKFVLKQIEHDLAGLTEEQIRTTISAIAYEPIWAINTGQTASPADAQEMAAAIREYLAKTYSPELASKMRILYGGSVKPKNAEELYKQPDIDGFLIGGASLRAEDFIFIAKTVARMALKKNSVRTPIVAGNWKAESFKDRDSLKVFKKSLQDAGLKNVEIILSVPFTLLAEANNIFNGVAGAALAAAEKTLAALSPAPAASQLASSGTEAAAAAGTAVVSGTTLSAAELEAKHDALIRSLEDELNETKESNLPAKYEELKAKLPTGISEAEWRVLFSHYENAANDALAASYLNRTDAEKAKKLEQEGINKYKLAIFFAIQANALLIQRDQQQWIGDINMLGGKIHNSLDMQRAGLPVPPFFGISSIAQKYIWLYSGNLTKMRAMAFNVDAQLGDSASKTEFAIDKIADDIAKDNQVPEGFVEMLTDYIKALAKSEGYEFDETTLENDVKHAVEIIARSSQGLEDLPGIPSAGIGSSIPFMSPSEMLKTIMKVSSSAYLRRALEYRDKIAVYKWLKERDMDEIAEVVAILGELDPEKKIEISDGYKDKLGSLVEGLGANNKEKQKRGEINYISSLRIMRLLELALQEAPADKKEMITELMDSLEKDRIVHLDPARIGGGIQMQIMRSSAISIVAFAASQTTGWTGADNDLVVEEYDIAQGRGENVVQGNIISDHYKVAINKKTGEAVILEKTAGSKVAKLVRANGGEKLLEWKSIKDGTTQEVIGERGKEYNVVVPVEDRKKFVVDDARALEIARHIFETNEAHNKGKKGEKVIPVDMEAVYYYDLAGNLQYNIVQKRDTALGGGLDFEAPEFSEYKGKELNKAGVEKAQEEGRLIGKGFETGGAANGEAVWIEEVSAIRVGEAVGKIWHLLGTDNKKAADIFKELLPVAHRADLYADQDIEDFLKRMMSDKEIVSQKVQDDFNVFDSGNPFEKSGRIGAILSDDYSVEETVARIKEAFANDSDMDSRKIEKLIAGVRKLYAIYPGNWEARASLMSTITRLNYSGKGNGNLSNDFEEKYTKILEMDILNKQIAKVKVRLEKNEKIILVVPETNPNFNDIMQLVDSKEGATVTLQGGKSAHAIVIAIQFGYAVVGGTVFQGKGVNILEQIKAGKKGIKLSVDANEGTVYSGTIKVDKYSTLFQPRRWLDYGRYLGLITNSVNEVAKNVKFLQWFQKVDKKMYPYRKKDHSGAYAVSLDRIEEVAINIKVDFRTAFAYDRMKAIAEGKLNERDLSLNMVQFEKDAAKRNLTEQQKQNELKNLKLLVLDPKVVKKDYDELLAIQQADILKLRGNAEIQNEIKQFIEEQAYTSAVEYVRYKLSRHFVQMAAPTKPGQIVQVRQLDLKKREIARTMIGASLYYNDEEASMIGDRGSGNQVRLENQEAFKIQILALNDAIEDAQKLGVGGIGFMMVFNRTIEDFQKGLDLMVNMRRNHEIEHLPAQVGAMAELTINALMIKKFNKVLREFRENVLKEFELIIDTYYSFGTNDMTQSIKGSRDESRYAKIMIMLPDADRTKLEHQVFYEGDEAVIEVLLHIALAAAADGNKIGLCGEAINSLLSIATTTKDPEIARKAIAAARKIVTRLDSVGISVKNIPNGVKLLADAALNEQYIPDAVAENARELASGVHIAGSGADYRRAVFIRSDADLTRTYRYTKDGGKKKEEKILPKAAEGDVLVIDAEITLSDALLKNLQILGGYASGVVVVGESGSALEEKLQELDIPSMRIEKDDVGDLGMEDLQKYVFDFNRNKIYASDNISFAVNEVVDDTTFTQINWKAKPEKVAMAPVKMDDVYKRIGIHPLALALYHYKVEAPGKISDEKYAMAYEQHKIPLAQEKLQGMFDDIAARLQKEGVASVQELIAKAFREELEKVKKASGEDARLVFETSDADVWSFEKLAWGKKDIEMELNVFNVPIDLRGLLKTVSPGYDDIFKMFLQVVKEDGKKDNAIKNMAIQFNYVQDPTVLKFGLKFLDLLGLNDGREFGMSFATSRNWIRSGDNFGVPDGKISFVTMDTEKMLMNMILGNMDSHTDVMYYDGSMRPLIDKNHPEFRKALKMAVAMARTDMVKYGVKETIPVKANIGSIAGNTASNTAQEINARKNAKESERSKEGALVYSSNKAALEDLPLTPRLNPSEGIPSQVPLEDQLVPFITAPNGNIATTWAKNIVEPVVSNVLKGTGLAGQGLIRVDGDITEVVRNEIGQQADLGMNVVSVAPAYWKPGYRPGKLSYVSNITVDIDGEKKIFKVWAEKVTSSNTGLILYIEDAYHEIREEDPVLLKALQMKLLGLGAQEIVNNMQEDKQFAKKLNALGLPFDMENGNSKPAILQVNGKSGIFALPALTNNARGMNILKHVAIGFRNDHDDGLGSLSADMLKRLGVEARPGSDGRLDLADFGASYADINIPDFNGMIVMKNHLMFVTRLTQDVLRYQGTYNRKKKQSEALMALKPGVGVLARVDQIVPHPYSEAGDIGRGTTKEVPGYSALTEAVGFDNLQFTDILEPGESLEFNTLNIDPTRVPEIDANQWIAAIKDATEGGKVNTEAAARVIPQFLTEGFKKMDAYKNGNWREKQRYAEFSRFLGSRGEPEGNVTLYGQWLIQSQWRYDLKNTRNAILPEQRVFNIDAVKKYTDMGFAGIRLNLKAARTLPTSADLARLRAAVPKAVIMVVPPANAGDEFMKMVLNNNLKYVLQVKRSDMKTYKGQADKQNVVLEMVPDQEGRDEQFKTVVDLEEAVEKMMNSEYPDVTVNSKLLEAALSDDPELRERTAGEMNVSRVEVIRMWSRLNGVRLFEPLSIERIRARAFAEGRAAAPKLSPDALERVMNGLKRINTGRAGRWVEAPGFYVIPALQQEIESLTGKDREEALSASEKWFFEEFESLAKDSETNINKGEKDGHKLAEALSYADDLKKKTENAKDDSARKMEYITKLAEFTKGLMAELDAQRYPVSIEIPEDENETFAQLNSLAGSLVGESRVDGSTVIMADDPLEQMVAFRGALLSKGRFDDARETLLAAARDINAGAVKEPSAQLMFAAMVYEYYDKSKEKDLSFIFGGRKQGDDAVIKAMQKAVEGYEEQKAYALGLELLYHNAFGAIDELTAKHGGERNNVYKDKAAVSEKKIIKTARTNWKVNSGEIESLADFVEQLPYALLFSHNQELFRAFGRNSFLKEIEKLATPYGLRSTNGTVFPAMIGFYADLKAAVLADEGKKPAEIQRAVKSLLSPLLMRLAKDGGIAETVPADLSFSATRPGKNTAAIAEFLRMFVAYSDRKLPDFGKMIKDQYKNVTSDRATKALLGAA